MCWNSAGAVNCGDGESVLSGKVAGDAGLNATQVHSVAHSVRSRRNSIANPCTRRPGLDPSMLIDFLY